MNKSIDLKGIERTKKPRVDMPYRIGLLHSKRRF